jgi:Uma2 family endonuclease
VGYEKKWRSSRGETSPRHGTLHEPQYHTPPRWRKKKKILTFFIHEFLRGRTTPPASLNGSPPRFALMWSSDLGLRMIEVVECRDSGTPGADPMAVLTPRAQPADPTESPIAVPALENGDRLSRAEFERRYEAMPQLKKAELIEGEVHLGSPVRHRQHGKPHSQLNTWLGVYTAGTPGVGASDNGSIRLDLDNEPQPDAFLMIETERDGQARISEDDYIVGAPELVAEIASSSVSYDLGKKLHVYRRNGVLEYVVWRVQDREVDWFVLRAGRFEPLAPSADGILRSTVFPGLWLDPAALLRGDLAAVLAILHQGLNSPEHSDFAARLRRGA